MVNIFKPLCQIWERIFWKNILKDCAFNLYLIFIPFWVEEDFWSNKTLKKEFYTVRVILRTSWIESQTVYTKRLLNDSIFWKFSFLTLNLVFLKITKGRKILWFSGECAWKEKIRFSFLKFLELSKRENLILLWVWLNLFKILAKY